MKTKIKSYRDEVTDFCDKEISKVCFNHTSLPVISLGSALNKERNCYPPIFFKKYEYIKKKVIRHIIQDIEMFSSDSDEE